jgi:lysozyme family protein
METHAAVVVADEENLRRRLSAERLDFLTGLSNWPEEGKGWARRVAANLRR